MISYSSTVEDTNPDHVKAARINAAVTAQYKAITDNRDLSDEAKRRQLAQAYLAAKQQIGDLRASVNERDAATKTALQRKVFGTPTDAISAMSYRDALGRAQQLSESPNLMQDELSRAMTRGDDLQARAIASTAYDLGYSNIVDSYASATPGVADTLRQLADAQRNSGDTFMEGLHYITAKPTELEGLGDWQMQSAAESA